jgi:hypothetical protein
LGLTELGRLGDPGVAAARGDDPADVAKVLAEAAGVAGAQGGTP